MQILIDIVSKSISLIDVFANLPGNVGRLLKSYIKVYVLPKLRRSYKTFLAAVSIFQMHHNFDPPKNKWMSTVIHQVLHLTYNHRKYLEHKLFEEPNEITPVYEKII